MGGEREREKINGILFILRVSETIPLKLNVKVIFLVRFSLFVILYGQGANAALITGLVCQMCNIPQSNIVRQSWCDCLKCLLS